MRLVRQLTVNWEPPTMRTQRGPHQYDPFTPPPFRPAPALVAPPAPPEVPPPPPPETEPPPDSPPEEDVDPAAGRY